MGVDKRNHPFAPWLPPGRLGFDLVHQPVELLGEVPLVLD
jgi:hypothetical protein